jgi:hypothetical protein
MNSKLWTKILAFDLDHPMSEYGFSTRLANENYWTKDFTEKAILEYRKFMYLAGTSDLMVSPSEIVDVVWHQHLIFTQSYADFCDLIGKTIQHLPSTHNREDYEKFKLAKERTRKLYLNTFGEQPKEIWEYSGMFESLELSKAKLKVRTIIILGILLCASLIIPAYYLLKPLFVEIENPDFLIGFVTISLWTVAGLEVYNRNYLSGVVNKFHDFTFIHHLQPTELIYLKTQKLSNVLHGTINQLVEDKKVIVNEDFTIEKVRNSHPSTLEEYQALEVLDYWGKTHYPNLIKHLLEKPVFWNVANCMDAFKKYFIKSNAFGRLFYINFGIFAGLFLLGLTRFTTGLLSGKPVIYISIAIIVWACVVGVYLWRLPNLVGTNIIPKLYQYQILPARQIAGNWQWQYFLYGTPALTASFIPIVTYIDRNNDKNSGSCGTTCGSSCGSSCGSCGGCGGGD